MNPEFDRERMDEVREFVLNKLCEAGLMEAYGQTHTHIAFKWTPKGAVFREQFQNCIKQLGFEANSEELASLMSITAGEE